MATSKPKGVQPAKTVSSKGGLVNVHNNAAEAIMSVLNYELSVAYHAFGSWKAQDQFWDDAFETGIYPMFGEHVDTRSLSTNRLKHVYEWDEAGQPDGRLWTLTKTKSSGGIIIGYKFLNSNKIVPIDPVLAQPGKTGRSVTAQHIFKKKASVMESGKPVSIRPVRGYAIVFHAPGYEIPIVFTAGTVTVKRPGGRYAAGGFAKTFDTWFYASHGSRARTAIRASGADKRAEDRALLAGREIPLKLKNIKSDWVTLSEIDSYARAELRKVGLLW